MDLAAHAGKASEAQDALGESIPPAHAEEPARPAPLAPSGPPLPSLAAVPPTGEAQPSPRLPPARGPRLPPARNAQAPSAKKSESEAGAAGGGPSKDQVRRYRERRNKANTPEELREALEYGVKVGTLPSGFLTGQTGGSPHQSAQEPAPTTEPVLAPPVPAAQPPAATLPGAPVPAVQAAPDLIMGVPRKAVEQASEQVHFVVTQLRALGLAHGWGAAEPEPLELFEEFGMKYECKGDPRKRLITLASVEMAQVSSGGDGSPMGRRAEIGVLAVALLGPGLLKPAKAVVGAVAGKVLGVARVLGNHLRRARR